MKTNYDELLNNAWLPKPIFRILSGHFLNAIDLAPYMVAYSCFTTGQNIGASLAILTPFLALQGFLATKGLSIGRIISARVLVNKDTLEVANPVFSLIRPPIVFAWSIVFVGYFMVRTILKGVGPQFEHDMTPYQNNRSQALGNIRMKVKQDQAMHEEQNHVRQVFSNADWLFFYDKFFNTTVISFRYSDYKKIFQKDIIINQSDNVVSINSAVTKKTEDYKQAA